MNNSNKITFLSIAFGILLSLSLTPCSALASFSDVPSTHPQYEAISALEDQGIIGGYGKTYFRPEAPITRAELLKILFSHIGFKPADRLYQTKFADVPADSWFAPYISEGINVRILEYNPDVPNYYPGQTITKIDALKLIMPVEGIPAPYIKDTTPLIFSDINPKSSFAYLVRAAELSGLYFDRTDKKFLPYKLLTRAEAVGLLYQAQLYRESGGGGTIIIQTDSGYTLDDTEKQLMENTKFPIFVNVWNKINTQYLEKNTLDKDKLIYGAIDGMVNSLKDPYSVFDPPAEATQLQQNLEGSYEGIGTVIDQYDGNFIIVSVIKDSPAEKAGVLAGDIIKEVDGKTVTDLTGEELINLIKGPAGSTVNLKINRDGITKSFSITRQQVTLNSVDQLQASPVTVPANIGYVSIAQFTNSTDSEFDDIISETMQKNPKGLILDLRDNPGGYLDTAYSVLGHFIANDQVIMYLKVADENITQKSQGQGEVKAIPIYVLVNKNTASAAEVVAAALQDYKMGKLIGETTYGKGTVQEVTTYEDNSLLKLSVAKWLSPLKRDINKIGLTPDIQVVATKDDLIGKTDTQLQRAIDEITKL